MDKIADNGDNVTFSCTISGNSSTPIHIVWFNEQGQLDSDDSDILIDTKVNGNSFSSNLTLIGISSEDVQTYTCSGSDGIDTITASAMLLSELYIIKKLCLYRFEGI